MAAAELADEGTVEKRRFLDQLNDFYIELVNYVFDNESSWISNQRWQDGKDPEPWASTWKNPIPRFVYVSAAGMDYLYIVAADIAVLVALVVVFFMLSYMQFLRYDVR